ncbi:hypothetical protein L1987_06177 [Smallanthus sonchifolius]|uniref:Uncharacterized protein n=1 Tax=Smallanthus sonchifolius TaxID=185202 RepID=A0ACB9JXL7_9ASTR|nr:hypothetical protein L1987_06177 [Smallanthus sonchifolius]
MVDPYDFSSHRASFPFYSHVVDPYSPYGYKHGIRDNSSKSTSTLSNSEREDDRHDQSDNHCIYHSAVKLAGALTNEMIRQNGSVSTPKYSSPSNHKNNFKRKFEGSKLSVASVTVIMKEFVVSSSALNVVNQVTARRNALHRPVALNAMN